LDELFLKGPGSKEAVKVGAKELGNKVAVFALISVSKKPWRWLRIAYISSKGEIKISLSEMTLIC